MDPAKQRAIASKGGKAAHAKGTAHRFTPEEASEAGRKGGRAAHAKGTAHRFTASEASAAGRKGGSSRSATARRHHEAGHEGQGENRPTPPAHTDAVETHTQPANNAGRTCAVGTPGEQAMHESEQFGARPQAPAAPAP
jgi:general stress protein YciG